MCALCLLDHERLRSALTVTCMSGCLPHPCTLLWSLTCTCLHLGAHAPRFCAQTHLICQSCSSIRYSPNTLTCPLDLGEHGNRTTYALCPPNYGTRTTYALRPLFMSSAPFRRDKIATLAMLGDVSTPGAPTTKRLNQHACTRPQAGAPGSDLPGGSSQL